MKIGATIDIDQIKHLGMDFSDVVEKVVQLPLSPIRIAPKWNVVEHKKKQYNWDEYDYLIKRLASAGKEIVLCVGMKSPRWPEFYIPAWATKRYNFSHAYTFHQNEIVLRNYVFAFIEEVIDRYGKSPSVSTIQVENEPLFAFGPHMWQIGQDFLLEEIHQVKKLWDKDILVTTPGLPTTGILAEILKKRYKQKQFLISTSDIDIIGFNIFPRFQSLQFKRPTTFHASNLAWRYLRHLVQKTQKENKRVWVSELQAEPWQINPVTKKDAFGNHTCNPAMVKSYIQRISKMGVETALLWGVEFHLACSMAGNDDWVSQLYKSSQSQISKELIN